MLHFDRNLKVLPDIILSILNNKLYNNNRRKVYVFISNESISQLGI